jgi:hypothetical protein
MCGTIAQPIDTDLNPAAGEWAVGQKTAVPFDRNGHASGDHGFGQ